MARPLILAALAAFTLLVAGCESDEARYDREYHQCMGEEVTDGGRELDEAISVCAELEANDRRIDGLRQAYRD